MDSISVYQMQKEVYINVFRDLYINDSLPKLISMDTKTVIRNQSIHVNKLN